MIKVLQLAISFQREHPVRVLLTSLATIAAASMVIWVASGYDALLNTFDEYANLALGRYTLAIAPISTTGNQDIPAAVLTALRADANIATADPMWAQRAKVKRLHGTLQNTARTAANPVNRPPAGSEFGFEGGPGSGPNGRPADFLLLTTDAPAPPFELQAGRWLIAQSSPTPEMVVRADIADRLNLKLNDELEVESSNQRVAARLVGIVNAPSLPGAGQAAIPILSPSSGEFFVSPSTAQHIFGKPAQISLLGISLKPTADLTQFRFAWSPKLSRFSTPVQFQEAYEIEEALDQMAAAQNVALQAFAATGVSMFVALLVIFCTLSMGVNERVRQFAVLRAVVLTRLQVAQLIAIEALLLGAIGFGGGLLVGQLMLWLLARTSAEMLHHGTSLGMYSIVLAALATFGGASLAAIVPAYRATRIRPMDAMAPRPESAGGQRAALSVALCGLALIAVNPILTFVFPPRFETGVYITMTIGFVAMTLGFVLIAPAIVALVDRCGSPLLARILLLDPKLLASQITSNLWRTVGAAISLAFGMGLYIGIQVWGFTMLEAFIPGPWAPDALIAFRPTGIAPEQAVAVAQIPGVNPHQCLPIVVEQPRLLEDITHSADRPSVTRQDNVVLVGLDPTKSFGGEHPLFELEWVAGSPTAAVMQMESGRGCLVPDHFLQETGLELGDSIALVPPENPTQSVKYQIAGAVKLPGWHWQTKLTGFRPRTHRAAALVFAKYETVAHDFSLPTASHVWLNFASPQADPKQIGIAAQELYRQYLGREVVIGTAPEGGAAVRVMPIDDIRNFTRGAAKRWIWVISQIPLISVVIAGLGVLNVILASVRARRWEFGVLRAVGYSHWTLVRVVLAEGLLIGFVACLLSLGFGILAGWCGCGAAQYISFFGGLHPAVVIPWASISLGLAGVLALATLAAVWPAISIGRARPLDLLQGDRGAYF